MAGRLIAIFTFIFLLTNQSFGFVCPQVCGQQKGFHSEALKITQNHDNGNNYHQKRESRKVAKAPVDKSCPMMSVCEVSVNPSFIGASQIQEKLSAKKVMIRDEVVVPDLKIAQQVPNLTCFDKLRPQKIRLHLRLCRLLN